MALITVNRFGKDIVIDERLKTQLDVMLERTQRQFDNIIIVTGMEGTGKSKGIAFPVAQYLSGKFEVVFDWKQFKEAYETLPIGSTIVWDEFIFAGMAADALSTMQKQIIQMMVTGRKKMINVVLVVPSVFLLKNYFAVHRALFMIHTDSPDFLSRGYAYFYGYQQKRKLYNLYKKTQFTRLKLANFDFKFVDPKIEYYDYEMYEKKKDEAIKSIGEDKEETKESAKTNKERVLLKALHYLKKEKGFSWKDIDEMLINQETRVMYSQLLQKYKGDSNTNFVM